MKKIFMAALAATTLFSACQNSVSSDSLKTDVDSISYAFGLSFSIPEANLKQGLVQMGSDSAYVRDFQQGLEAGIRGAEDKKALAYNIGLQQGMMISQRQLKGIEQQLFANDSVNHINVDLFLAGLKAAAQQKGILLKNAEGQALSPEELNGLIDGMFQSIRNKSMEAQYGEYKQENLDFMANIAKEEGIKELGNGVYYKELQAGKGDKAVKGESLELTYEGRMIDGKVFDSTKGDNTVKFPVGVGRVIAGFDAALLNMPEGAEWEVYIPAEQGYGSSMQGEIKPFSTLIFKIKAVKVIKADKK